MSTPLRRPLLAALALACIGCFTAAPAGAQAYSLAVSSSASRATPVALQGATLGATAYVYTSLASNPQNANPAGVTRVCFWLDNTAMTGTAARCESAAPYDYAGSVNSTATSAALPWSTASLARGAHTITQAVTLAAGGSEVDTATFTLPATVSVAVSPTTAALLTNGMQQFTATVLNASNAAVTWTATCGAISATGLYTAPAVAGSCSVLATSVADATKSASATVTVSTVQVPNYALAVSTSATHAGGVPLQGATLSGLAYVYTSLAADPSNFDPAGITRVCFWLDNPAMTGTATHCESTMPYDYIGSVSSAANSAALAWSVAAVASGSHTITQAVTLAAGGSEVETATFTIGSVPQAPVIAFSASPSAITPGQSTLLSWTVTNAATVLVDNGIGAVSATGSFTVSPTANTTYTLTATSASGVVASQGVTVIVGSGTVQHYEYVFPDGDMYVYDMDNNFQLVKHVSIPQTVNIRGTAVLPATHMLYISYGGNGGAHGNGSLLKYDLLTDTVVWRVNYPFGIDSFAITPDGSKLYMPEGDAAAGDAWYIIDPVTGSVTGTLHSGQTAPHNTIVSLDGSTVFMGALQSGYLAAASTASDTVTTRMGPLNFGIRPFTINGKHTLSFTTATFVLGFQVENTTTGAMLFYSQVPGYGIPAGFEASHGISLSPDERELYLIDTYNVLVHVFDVTGLPGSAPKVVAHIPISNNFAGVETAVCTYDCSREGWLHHSLDGRFVFVGDAGNVIDTRTRQVVATLAPLANTRKFLEVDWQGATVIATSTRHGLGYVK